MKPSYMGIAVALGAATGAAIGAATGHMAGWVAIGVAAGAVIAFVNQSKSGIACMGADEKINTTDNQQRTL